MVTMYFPEKHLPEKGLLLDAGGGPGRYTIELAKKGLQDQPVGPGPRNAEACQKED